MKPLLFALTTMMPIVATSTASSGPGVLDSLQPAVAAAVAGFAEIPVERKAVLEEAAAYIRRQLSAGRPARLSFICTHNSRRSQMAQVWAQVAAHQYAVRGVESFSGGTEVTACNLRTIEALRRAGFAIAEPAAAPNPAYAVHLAPGAPPVHCSSKRYLDAPNPPDGFAAFLCCGHADAGARGCRGLPIASRSTTTIPRRRTARRQNGRATTSAAGRLPARCSS